MKAPFKMMSVLMFSLLASAAAHADDCDSIRADLAKIQRKQVKSFEELGTAGTQVPYTNVYIQAGQYNCESPIVLDKSYVRLIGAGKDKVNIRLADNHHAPVIIIGNKGTHEDETGRFVPNSYVEHIQVSGISIDGNRDNHDTSKECGEHTCDGDTTSVRNNGVTIRGAKNILVKDVIAHSMISGGLVTEKRCEFLTVDGFESYNNFFDGLAGYETDHSIFRNLNLHHNKGAGISTDIEFSNNIFENSKFNNNGDVGIFARDQDNNLFRNVEIINSGNHGVFLARSFRKRVETCAAGMVFENVTITNSKYSAIRVNDECRNIQITKNSNICDNGAKAVSETMSGLVQVDKSVSCGAEVEVAE